MNQLTQYQLNYVATFMPQYEKGILNFICRKFNDPKLKVSIWGFRKNIYLSSWYCSYFKFNYFKFRLYNEHNKTNDLMKWTIDNDAFYDFKIFSRYILSKTWHHRNMVVVKYLIDLDLDRYIKLLIELKYINLKTLFSWGFNSGRGQDFFDGNIPLGFVPYCIIKRSHNSLNYIVKTTPKKYMIFYGKQKSKSELTKFNKNYKSSVHWNSTSLDVHSKKKYYDFLRKHDLLYEQHNNK